MAGIEPPPLKSMANQLFIQCYTCPVSVWARLLHCGEQCDDNDNKETCRRSTDCSQEVRRLISCRAAGVTSDCIASENNCCGHMSSNEPVCFVCMSLLCEAMTHTFVIMFSILYNFSNLACCCNDDVNTSSPNKI